MIGWQNLVWVIKSVIKNCFKIRWLNFREISFMKGLPLFNLSEIVIIVVIFYKNWPDLWRDCHSFASASSASASLIIKIDLIYEGIATVRDHALFQFQRDRYHKNWPDLWRDCHWWILIQSLQYSIIKIDLIYEGIATYWIWTFNIMLPEHDKNWPDLWRDCHTVERFCLRFFCNVIKIDLIYEGIATH